MEQARTTSNQKLMKMKPHRLERLSLIIGTHPDWSDPLLIYDQSHSWLNHQPGESTVLLLSAKHLYVKGAEHALGLKTRRRRKQRKNPLWRGNVEDLLRCGSTLKGVSQRQSKFKVGAIFPFVFLGWRAHGNMNRQEHERGGGHTL